MPYSYVNLTTALSDLGARLYDPDSQFWNDAEKTRIIQEALRTWNAYTSFWRSEFVFDLIEDTIWYDISDLTSIPISLRPFTVTDVDLYNMIENHLLEPPTGAVWTGSQQFNADDMIEAVQHRRDEVLSATSCTVNRQVVAAVPGRTFLNDKTIDIRRIAWLPSDDPSGYTNSPLWPDDTWALESYQSGFTTQSPGQPTTYRQSTEPPLSFDVDITPAVPGDYEVISVDAGPALDADTEQTLMIPDDFTWVIKFGAMGDMLNRDSNARDSLRAAYCNARFIQGVALLQSAPAILYARIGNVPLPIDAVQHVDNFRPNWQAESSSQPDQSLIASLNLIGFAPTPDDGDYSVTLMVVENAPIPTTGDDKIQIGRDDYDVLLDYCVHLASFKMGGGEFLQTMPLFMRFLKQAAIYNNKLDALGEYRTVMCALSQTQAEANPVFSTPTPTALLNGDGGSGGGGQ